MIRSWANAATRRFGQDGKTSKFRSLDADAAHDLLAALNAATSLKDLSPLKSVGLHKLKGDRKGQWAMTVNGSWRICFRFKDGDALPPDTTLETIKQVRVESRAHILLHDFQSSVGRQRIAVRTVRA